MLMCGICEKVLCDDDRVVYTWIKKHYYSVVYANCHLECKKERDALISKRNSYLIPASITLLISLLFGLASSNNHASMFWSIIPVAVLWISLIVIIWVNVYYSKKIKQLKN